jgi:hypothetical protein
MRFQPVPSVAELFRCTNEKRFIFILGPVGSTKTTTVLMWLMVRAAHQAPSPDGLRYSRFAIVRNTLVSLRNTVLRDLRALFAPIADYRPSENIVRISVGDIRCEIFLLPLETVDDERRLLSLQLSGIFVNEVREVDWSLVMQAFSRTGRYPSMKQNGAVCSWRFLIADSNLGVEGSDLYRFLEEDNVTADDRLRLTPTQLAEKIRTHREAVLYIHQPGAFTTPDDPDPRNGQFADWLSFLPKTYYQDAMIGASREWVRQHVHSMWGLDLAGMPVYGGSFIPELHVAACSPGSLKVFKNAPLLVAFDPGLHPAMVVGQLAPNGQLRLLAEAHAPNILFRDFLVSHCIPLLQQLRFQGCPFEATLDPAGNAKTSVSKLTPKSVLQEYGFAVSLARTNDLKPRLLAAERWMMEMRGASFDPSQPTPNIPHLASRAAEIQPALLVDPICASLIEGFSGKYRYLKKKVSGELDDKPEKKHPISDVQDCFQYICLLLSRKMGHRAYQPGVTTGVLLPGPQPTPDPLGWT